MLEIKPKIMEATAANILDVTEIAPPRKHRAVFERFNELAPGEILILHNDHDPKPLYYELQAESGNIFEWQYLQKGPELWKVKISKTESRPPASDEDILDASQLEPRLKHPAIFSKFDKLEPGNHFYLVNDHDPVPLYYQLREYRGNIFTWDYIEKGPDRFKIKIAKPTHELPKEKHASGELIINVPALEPKMKHPTIFRKFDELPPGESLVIHNDHDPKPLYYQLLGERGNIFTWEYLEQGPAQWKIRILKRLTGDRDETLGALAAKDLRKAEVFKKYGLDFCCGGKKTVKEACAEKGLDVTKVEHDLLLSEKNSATTQRSLPYNDWEPGFLADYIVNTHHSYVKKIVPDLRHYSSKVAKVHGGSHPELIPINALVEETCTELLEHSIKEENEVFPLIKKIASGEIREDNLDTPISELIEEHELVGGNMEKIRTLSNDYQLPHDACASYSFLFKSLEEFENDLHLHVHLENNILFPKAIQLVEKAQ